MSAMLKVLQLPVLDDNYIYLIHDPASGATAVVDPALAVPVLDALNRHGWQLTYIFNTHHHSDHTGGNLTLKQQTGCKIIASRDDKARIPGLDTGVQDGDTLLLGEHPVKIMATPGHTLHHIVYYFPNDNLLFCGDTLFAMGCGRLFEGSARQMWESLQKIKRLPPQTQIYCAHEYTQANARFALSVDPLNPALQQRAEETVRLRGKHLPTVPSALQTELATNPFLRESDPAVQARIGLSGKPQVEVFTHLRQLKDAFV